jgi:hypothetical protein
MSARDGLTWARRFLVLIALMFWQGGFTFYAAVVVPIGQDVVPLVQPFITRRVAPWINIAGAGTLLLLALDILGERGRVSAPWTYRLRWLMWLGMAVALGVLVWLYPHIDRYLNLDDPWTIDRAALRLWHRAYLWVSTIQWGCGLVYVGLTLRAWRVADRNLPLAA